MPRSARAGEPAIEAWFSTPEMSSPSGPTACTDYHDYRRQPFDAYDPCDNVLFRLPQAGPRRPPPFDSLSTAMTLLAEQRAHAGRTASASGISGPPQTTRLHVLSQHVERVTEEGREWIDYAPDRHARRAGGTDAAFDSRRCTQQAAAAVPHAGSRNRPRSAPTKPASTIPPPVPPTCTPWECRNRRRSSIAFRRGTSNAFSTDSHAGRAAMDDYRAIVRAPLPPMDYMWWCDLPRVVYRKGDKLRTDYVEQLDRRPARRRASERGRRPGPLVAQTRWNLSTCIRNMSCTLRRIVLGRLKRSRVRASLPPRSRRSRSTISTPSAASRLRSTMPTGPSSPAVRPWASAARTATRSWRRILRVVRRAAS